MLTLDYFPILSERRLHQVMKQYQEYFGGADYRMAWRAVGAGVDSGV